MKPKPLPEIRRELTTRSHKDLQEICLKLARFKVDNKELLSYLLYDIDYEEGFIDKVKSYHEEAFEEINTSSVFYVKKGIRKILKNTKKYIRYSKKKETEIEVLMSFLENMKESYPRYRRSTVLSNLYNSQLAKIETLRVKMHEDLQFDYREELKEKGLC